LFPKIFFYPIKSKELWWMEELNILKKFLERGLINEKEFKEKKTMIVNKLTGTSLTPKKEKLREDKNFKEAPRKSSMDSLKNYKAKRFSTLLSEPNFMQSYEGLFPFFNTKASKMYQNEYNNKKPLELFNISPEVPLVKNVKKEKQKRPKIRSKSFDQTITRKNSFRTLKKCTQELIKRSF
jgi:hypothetical protein